MMALDLTSLSKYKLTNVPDTVYYIPNFISEEEEESIIKQVYAAPKPKWTQLSNRRLQNWGGLPHEKGMIPEKMPPWLDIYCKKVAALDVFEKFQPNHVLVNEYLPGQGIMPHTDGPLYYPTVANVTLGCHTMLDWYHSLSADGAAATTADDQTPRDTSLESRHFASLLLERRSLVLVRDVMYSHYLHGIRDTDRDTVTEKVVNLASCPGIQDDHVLERTKRVSLTIRYVPKVLKTKIFLGKR